MKGGEHMDQFIDIDSRIIVFNRSTSYSDDSRNTNSTINKIKIDIAKAITPPNLFGIDRKMA